MAIYRPTPADPGRAQARPWSRYRWGAAVAAFGLVVSACGTNTTGNGEQSQGVDGEPVVAESENLATAAEDGDIGDDGGGAESRPASESDMANEPAVPAMNVPAVEVVDLTDGSVINLADELAGEERAILFWFWAPH